MLFKAYKSRQNQDWGTGLADGALKPCGAKPNCVSSVNDPADKKHYIAPITASSPEALDEKWTNLQNILKSLNFAVVMSDENYIHATETTKLMKFVDDVEFQKRSEDNSIQIKSKSRVGYSDLNANRNRLEKILEMMASTSR